LALPYGVAIDRTSNHLYIADTANNRVLGWSNVSALTNGAPADLVIGQTNFTNDLNSNTMGDVPVSGLSSPWSVAVDSKGNLYVSDNGNNRVPEYNSPYNAFGHTCNAATPCEGGLAANLAIGQGTTVTPLPPAPAVRPKPMSTASTNRAGWRSIRMITSMSPTHSMIAHWFFLIPLPRHQDALPADAPAI
jgi:DNA-binding beta-propeller fold protein YncE